MRNNSIVKKGFMMLAATLLVAGFAVAQGGPGGGVPQPTPTPPNETGAPIDGGAIALLAGAAAYTYRKVKKKN